MNELLNILTDLLDEIRDQLPTATEDQKNDLRALVRSYTEMVNQMDGVPSAGLSWTKEEDTRLKQAYQAGLSFDVLAQKHGRTRSAIVSRLAKLGIDTTESVKSASQLIAEARARLKGKS